ncbi:hypothetical protein VP01_1621g5, partial [Puccinia sorghi]
KSLQIPNGQRIQFCLSSFPSQKQGKPLQVVPVQAERKGLGLPMLLQQRHPNNHPPWPDPECTKALEKRYTYVLNFLLPYNSSDILKHIQKTLMAEDTFQEKHQTYEKVNILAICFSAQPEKENLMNLTLQRAFHGCCCEEQTQVLRKSIESPQSGVQFFWETYARCTLQSQRDLQAKNSTQLDDGHSLVKFDISLLTEDVIDVIKVKEPFLKTESLHNSGSVVVVQLGFKYQM